MTTWLTITGSKGNAQLASRLSFWIVQLVRIRRPGGSVRVEEADNDALTFSLNKWGRPKPGRLIDTPCSPRRNLCYTRHARTRHLDDC